MTQVSHPAPRTGDPAPNCILPDGSRLADLRGQPVILAFAPDEWNPAHAHQSEIFARLSREFAGGATFVDASADDAWRSLDSRGELATQFGVGGRRRALFLLDEQGVVRWKIEVEDGRDIPPGQVLAALEALKAPPAPTPGVTPAAARVSGGGGLSRRAFLTATLAAAAILTLPPLGASAAPAAAGESAGEDQPDRGGTVPVTLKINGQTHRLRLEPRVALLDALRENLHLTGSKKGCDHGQCGACTVHINGQSALSCLTLAVMSQGKEITTIEGIASGETLHPVQAAFIRHDAFQCGYCTPGQIMAATALLQDRRTRSEAEIREAMSGNLCRCAAYPNIIAAVKEAQSFPAGTVNA